MNMDIPEIDFGVYDSTYDTLQAYMEKLAQAAPNFVRKSSIGTTPEGRDLTLLTLADFAACSPENNPALLIFANMHCHELSGPIAALTTARNLLRDNRELLKDHTFYIIPRINPDSTEKVVRHSGYIRSRWEYSQKVNVFRQRDLDGNGIIAQMRKECPWGDMCIDPDNPQQLIPRRADSKGPFYLLFGEGIFEKWDGKLLQPEQGEGEYRDWNRSSLVGWNPTVEAGGDFPYSEPEMFALMKFMTAHKNIFGFINYHNGWGAVMGPAEVKVPDGKFLARLYDIASRHVNYPVFYGNEPMHGIKEPVAPYKVCGQFDDTAYGVYGLVPITLELGTYENSAGIRTEDVFAHDFLDEYKPVAACLQYQKEHPEYPRHAFHEWKPFEHPQLGHIEIGGFDSVGLASPAPELLAKTCRDVYEFTCDFITKCPRMVVADMDKARVAPGIFRIRVMLQNAGELPTNVLSPGIKSAWREKPYAELSLGEGVSLLSRTQGFRMPHFKAWEARELEWFVKVDSEKPAEATLAVDAGAAGRIVYPIILE